MTVGWRTLNVGEQALIYAHNGTARLESGPKRLFLFLEKFVPLVYYTADQTEYLKICYKDGTISNKAGPCAMFRNPVDVASIEVKKGISLDANEVLVVYRYDPKSQSVSKYLCHGPIVFIPTANEWLHDFVWHGTDPENKTRKIPGALRFNKLQVIPDQFYYNVDEVRTADDALIRIKLMIFYELRDIEHMLNSTQDPIADFINCTTADVIAFCAKLTYMEFIEHSSELNDLRNYPQLLERCQVIGYSVSKVGFRGYYASPSLQAMHDVAITRRTELRAAMEAEEQNQELIDVQLQNDLQRMATEQEMEIADLEHKHAVEKSETEHKCSMLKDKCMEKVKQKKKESAAQVKELHSQHLFKNDVYTKLSQMKVDLTQYILSQNPIPSKVIKVIADEKSANFHIHQAAS